MDYFNFFPLSFIFLFGNFEYYKRNYNALDARKFGKSNKRARGRGGRGNDGNLNGDSGAHMPQLDFYFSPRYAPPEKSFTIVSLVVNIPLLRMEQRFSTGLTHDSPENERKFNC